MERTLPFLSSRPSLSPEALRIMLFLAPRFIGKVFSEAVRLAPRVTTAEFSALESKTDGLFATPFEDVCVAVMLDVDTAEASKACAPACV